MKTLPMNEWLTFLLQERSKQNPDSTILSQCSLKYIQYSANVLAWAIARVTEQTDNQLGLLAEKQKLFAQAIAWYNSGNFVPLVACADSITESQNRLGPALIQRFEDKYSEVVQREEKSNRWFFRAYVIGSLLISIDFIKSKIQT